MNKLKSFCFPTLFFILFLPVLSFAYVTPGTGVNWTGDDLVSQSAGIVTFDTANQHFTSTETIQISQSDTLTITEDFLMDCFAEEHHWTVNGVFYAGHPDTTINDSVRFFGDDQYGFMGILVEPDGVLKMNRVIMQGGSEATSPIASSAIIATECEAIIHGCRFTEWEDFVIIAFETMPMIIQSSYFHDNIGPCIHFSSSQTSSYNYIDNCRFVNNNTDDSLVGASIISMYIWGEGRTYTEIIHSTIEGTPNNGAGGIDISGENSDLKEVNIRWTDITNCSYGIKMYGRNITSHIFFCNLINNNNIGDADNYGAGISLSGPVRVEASENIITGNLWGIRISDNVHGSPQSIHLGDLGDDPSTWGHNQLQNNFNSDYDHGYGLWNNSTTDIQAPNNYWGVADLNELADYIHDSADDPTVGTVTYEPAWDFNAPPVIIFYDPTELNVDVDVGSSQLFEIEAEDPEFQEVNYLYFLDGEPVDERPNITFDELGIFEVKAIAYDPQMAADSVVWNVHVIENSAPVIIPIEPEVSEVTVEAGDYIDFNASVTDPDDHSVHVQIYLDNEYLGSTLPVRISFPNTGEHIVKIQAWDSLQATSIFEWTVTVVDPQVVGDEGVLPKEFSIDPDPNPFNAQLRIKYSLPSYSDITYSIYSIDGRLVERQVLGGQQPGYHEVTWNAEGAASGVYLVRFTAGSESITRKITLVR